ncbi:MAG: hypothetical protein Q9160_003382 [Pyrenula sp. 1 TL-2023]
MHHAQAGLETPALEGLRSMLKDPTKDRHGNYLVGPRDWLTELPSKLQGNGFDEVNVFSYRERKCMAGFWSEMYILGLDEFADQVAAQGKDPDMETKIRKMASDAGEEVRKGGAIEYDKKVVLARKALE